MTEQDRGRVSLVNAVLAFASIVFVSTMSARMFHIVDMLRNQVDPFTSTLLGLTVPIVIIAVVFSISAD